MDADLDTLATARHVRIGDCRENRPAREALATREGICPKLTDAGLLALAILQALLRCTSKRRFLRIAREHVVPIFPCLLTQSGYNKHRRAAAGQMKALIHILAGQTDLSGDVLALDSTPVECGRSRPTATRSDLSRSEEARD